MANEAFLCEVIEDSTETWSEWLREVAYLGRRATDERAWVVVELHQNQLKLVSALSIPADRFRFRPWRCAQLWFVTLRKCPVDALIQQQAQLPTDNDAFKKIIERQNQYTQRQHINFLLDNDTTFAPDNLRHLIMALNPELLEKFYQAPSWDEAMQAVYTAIDKKKKERLEEKDKELARLRKAIEDAQAVKRRDDELRRLQTLFVDTVIEQRAGRQNLQSASPQALLQELLGSVQNRLLTVNNRAEPADAEIVA